MVNTNNEYTSLIYHKQRENDFIRDAEQHRLAQESRLSPTEIYQRIRRGIRINNN